MPYTPEDDFKAQAPRVNFTPGKEPEIVHTQQAVPAPRMAAVSMDALLMMRGNLREWSQYAEIQVVIDQIDRLIEAAND